MKITSVRTYLVDAGLREWLLVRIQTDEGVEGVGEGSLEGKSEAVAAAIGELARYLVGQDASRIRHHWEVMYRAFWKGGPVLSSALSAVEIALWDSAGKALGVPIYRLLGGAVRDRLRAYTHAFGETPAQLAAQGKELVARGWNALKVGTFVAGWFGGTLERRWPDQVVARVGALREAVGPDVDILFDCHGRLTPTQAVMLARELEPFKLFWYEEPVPPEGPEDLPWVASKVNIPLATGERSYLKSGFRGILERGGVAYLQPDVCHAGGILEVYQIGAMAAAYSVLMAPHNPLGPVATAACIQLTAALPNFAIQEVWQDTDVPVPWRDALVKHNIEIKDGFFQLPTRPGLGVEIDWEVAAAHPGIAKDLPRVYLEDGTVADW